MPLRIPRIRRWFAGGAILVLVLVAGAYFYASWRVQNALKEVPGKIGLNVQQSAQGFTVSRSEAGRTIFKIQASKAVQFKEGARAELHDVMITLYGRDSSRFDQIYGTDFEYDPQSGDVSAKGEVNIDLEANPEGLLKPDQAPPKELKNPIHLKTSGLIFNQKTGNAYTKERVEFSIPQANGSAVGVHYSGKDNLLTLQSQVNVIFNGPNPARLTAVHGTITKDPRQVVLERPHAQSAARELDADRGALFLRPDNTLDRVLATGNVRMESETAPLTHVRAAQLDIKMAAQRDSLQMAVLSGDVQLERAGVQPMQGTAGRVVMNFLGKNLLKTVHTEGNVKLVQHQESNKPSSPAQDLEVAAGAIDFFLASGRYLRDAQTSGPAQIALRPTGGGTNPQTIVTAGSFQARFRNRGRLASVHGAPDARITTSNPGQPDRVSSSNTVDVSLGANGSVDSIVQQGAVAYVDGERKAWADRARYTPADQMLTLTASPRVVEGGMTITANTMRLNRSTGDAFAEGNVKSTYSELKAQPNGALLASSSPIHVTSQSMTAHRSPAVAVYIGNARLWQEANVVQAPTIEFDRDSRSVIARGPNAQKVSTVLVQTDRSGKSTPLTITSAHLVYADSDRKAHFDGGVLAKGADLTLSASQMDVFLQARGQAAATQSAPSAGKVEKVVAQGQVVVTQPTRRATGQQLVYTSAEDKFVLTGGPPSIFDAEHGKITGVSLTFFIRDDRVLVEGSNSSPTVTQTRVAR
ncbi:MAG: LPS export ABC transporter periplasmic protein LptC [Acidobacteriales bacterium 13_2_20CM_55_8]|nr:MAG: LPS export ABC transporter periplasmic protein LptC [Acidobacteriales bacterium 13_2_20CM_55_8]